MKTHPLNIAAVGPGLSGFAALTLVLCHSMDAAILLLMAATLPCMGQNVSFAPATFYGVASYSVAVGDFNGDAKQDIIQAGQTIDGAAVAVLPGNGDGTFGPAIHTAWNAIGSSSRSVGVGDLNRAGKLDVVVADYLYGTVWVLLGKGDGTFGAPTSLYGGGAGLSFVAVADFNNGSLLVATKRELREYKCLYVQNDAEIGLFSDE